MLENNSVLHNSFRKCIYNTHTFHIVFEKQSIQKKNRQDNCTGCIYIHTTVGETDVQAIYKKIKKRPIYTWKVSISLDWEGLVKTAWCHWYQIDKKLSISI